jgi:serine protease AprX
VNPKKLGGHGDRNSALWGTGNRGGESRSNALWGKGGRGALLAAVASLAMVLPLAATAGKSTPFKNGDGKGKAYVAPSLLEYGKAHPDNTVSVIIQSTDGVSGAKNAYTKFGLGSDEVNELKLVGAIAAQVKANKLEKLIDEPGLIVTPDATVKVSALPYSNQLWPYEVSNANMWSDDVNRYSSSTPAIAIVDSGIEKSRSDFGGRVVASVNLTTLPGNSAGDGRGHGTFVAGVAAGAAAGYAGAAPVAKLVDVDVMDDRGVGRTSDIINACQWILDNKDRYNIRVANFSLHAGTPAHFTTDPLDRAVEKLWFGGVVVVAASGNYGSASGPSGVKFAPGNDPFIITVGAADIGGTWRSNDDSTAPWSAYGYTYDGFRKPEVVAPGRYMVGPVPAGSTLAIQRADKIVAPGYIQLSGTSFASPIVAGSAAQLLARHPSWTPDQVKGALMATATRVPDAAPGSAGLGEVTVAKADRLLSPPNPNRALNQFLTTSGGSSVSFDAASWESKAKNDASWDSASWLDASWLDASWLDASWDTASWLDASWLDASWLDASWLDESYEDAAEGDTTFSDAFVLSAEDMAEAAADPELPPDPATLPPAVSTVTGAVGL